MPRQLLRWTPEVFQFLKDVCRCLVIQNVHAPLQIQQHGSPTDNRLPNPSGMRSRGHHSNNGAHEAQNAMPRRSGTRIRFAGCDLIVTCRRWRRTLSVKCGNGTTVSVMHTLASQHLNSSMYTSSRRLCSGAHHRDRVPAMQMAAPTPCCLGRSESDDNNESTDTLDTNSKFETLL